MRVIDADGHIWEDAAGIAKFLPADYRPRQFPGELFPPLDRFHAFKGESPPGSFRQVGPDGWVEFMADVGIESAVLYPTWGLGYGNVFHLDWAIALARAYNNWLHEAYLVLNPRFRGMALIPMQESEAAAEELCRAIEELGFVGAMLPSTGLSDHLGAKRYWPVYREADRLGCALGIHGGAHGGMGLELLNNYTPVGALGHPFGQLINFGGIVFNGVLDRFPNVRWGFMEGGVAWLLLALERFERSHATHAQYNPRGELSPRAEESVCAYLRGHAQAGRVFVGCEGDEPSLAEAIRQIGSEPFVFSSDFPHEVNNEMCKHEIQELRENATLSEADKAAILHGNAARFYGLDRGAGAPAGAAAARG